MIDLSPIGMATALAAGAISFLSPCVLPLVPGYISYVAGRTDGGISGEPQSSRLATVGLSFCFVLGFSTVFILLGASATALGQMLLAYRTELNIVGGILVILFGIFIMGLIQPALLFREARFHLDVPGGKTISAYVLGLAFAFGWTPCIGPILGAILTMSAASRTVADGVALLAIYSLGLGLPFMISAFFTDALMSRIKSIAYLGKQLNIAAGAVLVVMGTAMITGHLSSFAFWLLETFPVFSRIG